MEKLRLGDLLGFSRDHSWEGKEPACSPKGTGLFTSPSERLSRQNFKSNSLNSTRKPLASLPRTLIKCFLNSLGSGKLPTRLWAPVALCHLSLTQQELLCDRCLCRPGNSTQGQEFFLEHGIAPKNMPGAIPCLSPNPGYATYSVNLRGAMSVKWGEKFLYPMG